jgi:hypothetical protein
MWGPYLAEVRNPKREREYPMSTKTIEEIARQVIDEAGAAGGIDEVRRIARLGWPSDVAGKPASPALLEAIRMRAESVVRDVDGESGA